MPRYFFQTSDPRFPPGDDEGVVLDGPEEARDQAVRTAGEMLHDLDGRFWAGKAWSMQVTDEEGRTVCTLRIEGTS